MALTQLEAWIFLPFAVPLCLYVAFTDLREMRITNQAVLVLGGLFLVLGLTSLPFSDYLWRLAHLVFVLVFGFALASGGAVGAGDAKFAAAAAPYVALGDLRLMMMIFAATLLGAFCAHRLAKHSPLRKLAPHWKSWDTSNLDFPMGLALGPSLIIYLAIGAILGS